MANPGVRRIEVEIDRLDQLFEASSFDFRDTHPRVVGGLDEAHAAARAGHHKDPVELTVRLPIPALVDVDEDAVRRSIIAFCLLRAKEVDHERDGLTRDGRNAMGTGILILAVGLLISQAVHHADLPEELDTFLADGVFLVVAWVGFWYPLDTLLYGRREAGRRADAWRDVANATITFKPPRTS